MSLTHAPPPILARRGPSAPRAIAALILREMSAIYGRSPGGYLWAVAEPAAGIVLLTFALSIVLDVPPLGHSFAIFYATGLVPFLYVNDLAARIAQSLNFSRQLLSYPGVSFIDAIVARGVLNSLALGLSATIIFAALWAFEGQAPLADPQKVIAAMGLATLLAFGLGTFNCFMMAIWPVWQQIWSIINRPLFLASAVFFVFDTLPGRYQDALWWNPLVHTVGLTRDGVYGGYEADYVSALYATLFALGCLSIGLCGLTLRHRRVPL